VPFSLHGIGVNAGVAIGRAHLLMHASLEVARFDIAAKDVKKEIARFEQALAQTEQELRESTESVAEDLAAFVNVHLMLLKDSHISEAPKLYIAAERCNAEWALKVQVDDLLAQFEAIDDAYIRERRDDVRQVAESILATLTGIKGQIKAPMRSRDEPTILVARDLSPADVILFKEHQFAAFITDLGGATSHTAIMARSLNIPSIVALHHARGMLREDDLIIIDGSQGIVIVDPTPSILAEYQIRHSQIAIERQKLQRLRYAPASTLDGTHVELHANIELPTDLPDVLHSGATGIGLFRSEFLFLGRNDLPDEEEQFAAYRTVVEGMEGLPVTIRTLDIGADKQLKGETSVAVNPALGLRAIRYCLAEPQMFMAQLRAILRASHFGKVEILIPMISNLYEIDATFAAIARVKEELAAQKVKFDPFVPVGGMIEIPAAAIALPMFLKKLDFISIGTNDLIQYTLAIDRADDEVAHLYNPLHPAILSLIAGVIRTAKAHNKPVTVCGEMAGEVDLTRLLLGFGLRTFSMHPAHLLEVKQRVLKSHVPSAESVVAKLLRAEDPAKIGALIDKLNAA
jgi:phosphoenolpyruvate-protein phosphotransferase (PTS system enzyme I)